MNIEIFFPALQRFDESTLFVKGIEFDYFYCLETFEVP